jgi:hypothetical protein
MKPSPVFLLVPLALASVAFSAVAPQQSSAAQEWRRQTQKTDSESVTTRFTLTGKFIKWPKGDPSSRPALIVDCGPGRRASSSEGSFVGGSLLVGAPLKIEYVEPSEIRGTSYYPKVSVVYRLNDAKEEKEKWTPGKEKTSASFSKNDLKKILRAHTLEITVDDESGSPIVMQFDMPDPAELGAACNVDERKK